MNPYSDDPEAPAGPHISTGDGTWVWQYPLPQGNSLNSVSCPTAATCFAVGNYGTILSTTDGGGHWNEQAHGISNRLNFRSVSCPTATTCFAVGSGILAYRAEAEPEGEDP
jgi:photosystem II stability/assembly factor-like uncharacterized protein